MRWGRLGLCILKIKPQGMDMCRITTIIIHMKIVEVSIIITMKQRSQIQNMPLDLNYRLPALSGIW